MISAALAFLLGVLTLVWNRELPDTLWLQFLPVALLLALLNPRARLAAFLVAGFLWALLRAEWILSGTLPASLEGRELVVQGVVESIPKPFERGVRFEFAVETLELDGRRLSAPDRLRLSWYSPPLSLAAGERWRLTVRLKRPHGFSNPAGFDYERWLFQHGIQATGYVRGQADNRRLGTAAGYPVARMRERIAALIDDRLQGSSAAGIVKALAVGVRDGIDDAQWQVLRATGTGHLMAISGLHIGLVAGLSFLLARRLWSLSSRAALLLAAPRAAALTAVLAAGAYAALAGFGLPTQRALIMVASFMTAVYVRGALAPGRGLTVALLAVLILDPLSVLSAGFWLSFGAVGVILLGMSGRLAATGLWWRWGRVHALVAVGLLPLTLAFFGENPWLAPLANLVAVPWMGTFVVPLVLAGILLILPFPILGEWLLKGGAAAVEMLWPLLSWLAERDLVYRAPSSGEPWLVLAAVIGVVLLLLPRGFPGRWLGLLWMAPLLLGIAEGPAPGELRVTLLDVGQGLATVVRTSDHVLVYDTGPRFSASFDAGQSVVLPFLRSQGITGIDTLIVSHGDSDHAGGVSSLLRWLPVERLLTSAPGRWPTAAPCRAGQAWRWDGVDFRILHPQQPTMKNDNNQSCVLRIVAGGTRFLLPGDIEKGPERLLVRRYGEELGANILIAPHHGSNTSSTVRFLDTVAPDLALFSVGYRNRFRLPSERVLSRYRERDVQIHDTATHGAITVAAGSRPGRFTVSRYRNEFHRFWNWQAED